MSPLAGEQLAAEAWRGAIAPGAEDGRLVREAWEKGQQPRVVPMPKALAAGVADALGRAGIRELYQHQAEAFEAALEGNVVIASATASGKSLAFNLPVFDAVARDSERRALYLYPTKALAQDQARKLAELAPPGARPALYDGDTPREDRSAIRRSSNLLLTNPDMLHVGICPHHRNWAAFLARLEYVVIDEAHVYRGVFGSHVANVLRRLRRVARRYGSDPVFLAASATIANPGELAEGLVGAPFRLIDGDVAQSASRRIAIWNPPLLEAAVGRRRSALAESAELFADLIASGARTICFLRSRRGVELIQRFALARLELLGKGELAARIAPYRAGYTPAQRREIEASLASGDLLGVVATNALELGIDIGELDAAICVTFPGTVASLRQMWGRAGRRRDGVAVYLAGEDALDQFFCRHPDEFLDRAVEAAIIDPANEEIRAAHLVSAAFELPLGAEGDDAIIGDGWRAVAGSLAERGALRPTRSGGFAVTGPGFPAGEVSLRAVGSEQIAVVEQGAGEVIGSVEMTRAFSTVHPGATYLHLGRSYEVRQLDIGTRTALVEPSEADWYTQPRKETDVWIDRVTSQRDVAGVELSFGVVSVTEQVIGYQRKRIEDHEPIEFVSLDLPEQSFSTQAIWYTLGPELAGPAAMPADALLGALHAAEHSQIAVLPLIAMCDRWDIGGLSTNVHPQTGMPSIFIYEGHSGGVGIARRAFERFEQLVGDAVRLVDECPCESGCPSCVQSPKCGNLNDPLHKAGAVELMSGMMRA